MLWVRLGALVMFLGVMAGAFGAHGLRRGLSDEAHQTFQTGVFYHLVHGLALLLIGWLSTARPGDPRVRIAGWCFLVGVILFSGSLYLLSLTGEQRLGIITPLGGMAFLIGWWCLFLARP